MDNCRGAFVSNKGLLLGLIGGPIKSQDADCAALGRGRTRAATAARSRGRSAARSETERSLEIRTITAGSGGRADCISAFRRRGPDCRYEGFVRLSHRLFLACTVNGIQFFTRHKNMAYPSQIEKDTEYKLSD